MAQLSIVVRGDRICRIFELTILFGRREKKA